MSSLLAYEGVTKRYGAHAVVDDLHLRLIEGETLVLIGPSGCGKTTTLKMANGLIDPTEGYVLIFGRHLEDWNLEKLRSQVGYVIQETGLFPHMTVWQNMSLLARHRGWSKERTRERAEELLGVVGLPSDGFLEKYPRQLSGGQAQRVGVARALMLSPRLLLMDEPFGALDPILRRKIQSEFLAIQKKVNVSILMVTHDMGEAVRLGDRVALMDQGKVVQVGTESELRKNPKAAFVREFFDAALGGR